jgi:hypothetical protein
MRKFIGILVIGVLLAACEKDNRWDCVKSLGDEQTEVRPLPPFTAVYIEHKIDLTYRYAEEYRIEVTFGENILPHLETEVRDGALYITNNARCNWVRDLTVKPEMVLYAPSFSYMENRSSGHITFVDTLHSDIFTYEEWNANGQNQLLIHSGRANIYKHTGSTLLVVNGVADTAAVYSASTGKLNTSGLISSYVNCNNSSIQDIVLYSSGYLFAIVYERGNILYTGNPTQIEQVLNGSGMVKPF